MLQRTVSEFEFEFEFEFMGEAGQNAFYNFQSVTISIVILNQNAFYQIFPFFPFFPKYSMVIKKFIFFECSEIQ